MKIHTSSVRILLWKKKARRDPRNHEKKDGGTEKVRGVFQFTHGYQVIQFVTFLSPIVGGHDSPLKRSRKLTIPKRSRSQNHLGDFFLGGAST